MCGRCQHDQIGAQIWYAIWLLPVTDLDAVNNAPSIDIDCDEVCTGVVHNRIEFGVVLDPKALAVDISQGQEMVVTGHNVVQIHGQTDRRLVDISSKRR